MHLYNIFIISIVPKYLKNQAKSHPKALRKSDLTLTKKLSLIKNTGICSRNWTPSEECRVHRFRSQVPSALPAVRRAQSRPIKSRDFFCRGYENAIETADNERGHGNAASLASLR